MKKIKYRVWVKNKEVMLPVTGLEWDYQKGEHLDYVVGGDPTGCPDCDGWEVKIGWEIKIEDCVLMQFTGLKDCNGVDIYEGDIIKLDRTDCNEIGIKLHVDKVRRSETGCYYVDDKCLYKCRLKKCEVIGNIYENPELLNQELEDVED